MCDCIKRICKDIREGEFQAKNPDLKKLDIIDADCDLSGWVIGEKELIPMMYIPFTINHVPIGRKKTTTVKMIAKYCPFCGEKMDKEESHGNPD